MIIKGLLEATPELPKPYLGLIAKGGSYIVRRLFQYFLKQMTLTTNTSLENAVYRKVSWRLIPILLLGYCVAYLDRVNISFAKLQMLNDLGMSDYVYGLGAGIFFLGYFLFEIPSNLILHKIGARIWIARIAMSWGIISGAMIFVSSPTTFYVGRFLLGIAEAGFFPGIILYLTYWYPAHRRGRIVSLFMTAVPLAGVFGGPLSGFILEYFNGIHGFEGWKWLFVLEGIPSCLVGVALFFLLTDSIEQANWLSPEEKSILIRNMDAEEVQKSSHSILEIFKNAKVWFLSFVYLCFVVGVYGVSFWLPSIIQGMGFVDLFDVGLLSAIPYGFSIVAMFFISKSSDHTRERRWHLALTALAGAIGLVISVIYAHAPWIAMAALSVAAGGVFTIVALFWTLPTAFLGGIGAATGIALINSIAALAGFVAPYIIGLLKECTGSTNAGVFFMAICLVIGAFLTLLIPTRLVSS